MESGQGEGSGFRRTGRRVGALLGVPTSLLVVFVIGNMWASCDVGVNASANSGALVLIAPFVWGATVFSWVAVYGAVGRVRRWVAVLLGVLVNLGLMWFFIAWLGVLDSYPAPVCRGNIPEWWPAFIPV